MLKTLKTPVLFIAAIILLSGCSHIKRQEIRDAKEFQTQKIQPANIKIHGGEKLRFSVRWLGLEVGTVEAKVEGIEEIRGRKVFHISVHVRSNSVIDLVYRVRDEHHTYLDVEKLCPLRYEKILKEGNYGANEVTDFDQDAHTAVYYSRTSGDRKHMLIPKNVQDQLSCGYWFRLQDMNPGDTIHIPVNADEKNWDLEVHVLQFERVTIKGVGVFNAVQVDPKIQFQGIFVRRGEVRGWMSVDEKRLPLMMKTKIPILGTVSAVLTGYEGI